MSIKTPKNWSNVILSEVCKINPPRISTKGLSENLEVSFIPMSSLSARQGIVIESQTRKLSEVKTGFTNFSENDILFAKITPCMENGKSAIVGKLVNDIGYGSTEFYVIRCSDKLYNRFLYHLIRSEKFREDAKKVMTGSVGQLRVPKKFLENYKLYLPPIDEQRKIVEIIDRLFTKLNAVEEKLRLFVGYSDIKNTTIGKIDLMKNAILARAFRGELETNEVIF